MDRSEHEARLRRRILDGDRTAWDELYDQCFDSLWISVARRVGARRDRIEDVVQETWLIAIRKIRRFQPERGPFRAWLHGIAEHVLRNAFRRWQREAKRQRSLSAEEATPAPSTSATPDARELLEASFASLPESYRGVLQEKYVSELSVEEIARRHGATPKAIESRLTRARHAFREIYQILARDPSDPQLRRLG